MSSVGHAKILYEVLMKEKLLEASLRRSVCQLGKERDDAFAVMKKSQLAHTLAVAKHENMQSELKQKLITVGLIREAWDDVRVDVVPAGTAGGDADGSGSSATATTAGINGSAPDSRTVTVAGGTNGVGGDATTGINGSAPDSHTVTVAGGAVGAVDGSAPDSRTVTVAGGTNGAGGDATTGINGSAPDSHTVTVAGGAVGSMDGSADDGPTVAVDDSDGANGAGVSASNAGINGSADVEPDFQDSEEFEALLIQNVIETEAKVAKMSGTLSASAVVVDSPVGVNVARSTEVGAGSGGKGEAGASIVNGTVVVDTPVGDIGSVVVDTPPGISDTARKLKDICLLIPTLSPREKSKRNRSNVITHEPKSKKNAPSKTKRVKSVLA
jgi:hypothetical protein